MAILLDYNQSIIASVAMGHKHFGNEISMDMIRHMFLSSLLMHRKKFKDKYGEVVICCDAPNSWRKEVFPFYKANRKKSREATPINWELAFECIAQLRDELDEFFPYKVVRANRAEGDDVIGVLTQYLHENDQITEGLITEPHPLMILSSDKDFKQLQIFPNVDQYSPILKKNIRENRPDLYLKEHIIRGDSGDGIPNFLSPDDCLVMGVRQKGIRAIKLEKWLEMTTDQICETEEMQRNYARNARLIDLLHYIPKEIEEDVIEKYESANVAPRSNLLNYFIKNKLKNLMTDIESF